jgi:predicted nucleic acid-binding protein
LIRVWPLNDEIAETAVSVVERFHLKSGDAINLATASTLKSREPDASLVMVSADRELLEASADAGLQTLNPQAANASQQLSDLRD